MGERALPGTRSLVSGTRPLLRRATSLLRRAGDWYHFPVLVSLAVAVVLAGLWLAAPPMGTDLSAQVARADFFAAYGWAPVDFRWYGGVNPHEYSLLSPPLMAWFGPRPAGAAAAVVSTVALALLLVRTGAPRPLLGGVLGAACVTGNLVSGRITFALGVALGLLALLALVPAPAGHQPRPRWWQARGVRLSGAALLALLAAAASPVAGLFVGLVGVALVLAHPPSFGQRGRRDAQERPRSPNEGTAGGATVAGGTASGGVVLAVAAAVPLAAVAAVAGAGGPMNMSTEDLVRAAGASLAVAALVPHRVVRVGALLSAAGVVAAYLLPTPVGLNATRLAVMFSLPLVAAYAVAPAWLRTRFQARLSSRFRFPARFLPRWTVLWLVPLLVLLVVWQPPVIVGDLARAGEPAASREFFAPLARELASRQPAGRVEVVPTRHYWEAAHLGAVPLARGWLRQADTAYHPLFFDGTLDQRSYRRWLLDNGVSYVALADTSLSWVGRAEAALIRQGVPYLTVVWKSDDWTLYEVDGATGLVEEPAVLREAAPDRVVFDMPEAGEVLVRVRWSRWLAVAGPGSARVTQAGDWTEVRVSEPGTYRLTGSLSVG